MTLDPSLLLVDRLRHSGLSVHNRLLINLLSEFFATFILLFVGSGTVAQLVLAKGGLNDYVQVSLAWGVLIALCVYATYHTSGGHMNPAVSLAMVSMGKLPLMHFPAYCAVQTFGAFLGAGLCYHVYADQLNHFDAGLRSVGKTGGIFCSFPASHVGHYTAFVDQLVGTGLLLFAICALIDPRNRVPAWLHPPAFGAAIFMICSSYGMNVGNPINPARDFGPRLFLLVAGYGWEAFSWHGYYFWIPLLAPFPGALIGTWSYQLFIGIHVPDPAEDGNGNLRKKRQLEAGNDDDEVNPLNSVVP